MPADEFIGRFLLHVLPDGCQRIRHYGLFANRNKRPLLRRGFEVFDRTPPPPSGKQSARTHMLELTGIDIAQCLRRDWSARSGKIRASRVPSRSFQRISPTDSPLSVTTIPGRPGAMMQPDG